MGRTRLHQNLSAVTAACLVIRRAVFAEVEGFDEAHLPVAFNDVDLCLRVEEKGYRNLWTPYAELYHYESANRGYEDTPEKQRRFKREIDYMLHRWGDRLLNDPAYNANLTLERTDFSLAFPPRVQKPWRS
jgi:GT2 family glycosyltransferase